MFWQAQRVLGVGGITMRMRLADEPIQPFIRTKTSGIMSVDEGSEAFGEGDSPWLTMAEEGSGGQSNDATSLQIGSWVRDVEIQHVAWRHSEMLLGGNVALSCGNARMPERYGKLFDGRVAFMG